jgi:ankyrin repeat protein
LAAQKDSLAVGKLLIENGADIDAMNKYGHTSRHWVMGSLEELSLNSLISNMMQIRNSDSHKYETQP